MELSCVRDHEIWVGLLPKTVIVKFWYWAGKAWAKNVDPDQMPQYVAYDQGLHWLPFFINRLSDGLVQILDKYVNTYHAG